MPALAILALIGAATSAILAIGALLQQRRSLAQWSFAAGMVAFALESVCAALSVAATSEAMMIRWQSWRLVAMSLLPGPWAAFSLVYSRAEPHVLLRRYRVPLGIAALAVPLLATVLRSRLIESISLDPETADAVLLLAWPGLGLHFCLLAVAVFVLAQLERTYRASVGTVRWRIKFVVLGVGVLFATRLYTSTQTLLFGGLNSSLDWFRMGALFVAAVLLAWSLGRGGKYETVVYPSRAVLQNSLTIALAGLYLLAVGVFAQAAAWLGGDAGFALKAFCLLVALVGLAILLQSDRLRLRLRRFISQHFQRPHFDYRLIWTRCTSATALCVDEASLARAIVTLAADVLQSLSVTFWLVEHDRCALAAVASTSIPPEQLTRLRLTGDDTQALIARFQTAAEPCDLEESDIPWAAKLRELHPSTFPHGGHQVCAPIINHGEVIGVILLGDRVAGVKFTAQDLDLLRCIGAHASANLASVQLARELAQGKEIAAFQTMATFLVHDLKNAVAALNLTLENLPIHFNDPEFRADALRGMGKTVANMNQLIGRLGSLRDEAKVRSGPADINAIVRRVTGVLQQGNVVIIEDLGAVPPVAIDPEQLHKVVTNLVLNAQEASAPGDVIRVTTRTENGHVQLEVVDRGCGMSEEFLRQGLFRPFRTTKKGGLGIGMFQCKTMIEAHRGRISVESESGRGTTFRVSLPPSATPADRLTAQQTNRLAAHSDLRPSEPGLS